MSVSASPDDWDLALKRCADEQIQFIGQVQADSVLVAMDPLRDRFSYLSANAGTLLGEGASSVPPSEIFGAQQLSMLSKRAHSWNGRGARLVEIVLPTGTSRSAWLHSSGGNLVIEMDTRLPDESGPDSWDWEDLLRDSLDRVEKCPDLLSKLEAVVAQTARLGEFDRVMIYRFLADGTGEVVAERVRPDWESYLGLRYPASDIPAQARELFLKNDIRLIREVAAAPVPILSFAGSAEDAPLDLSRSRFRQPSPIHLEYLKNMGVASSFVTAIICEGKLWGLISCHHGGPLDLSAARQVQLAALTNHLANDIAGMAREVRLRDEIRCARITSKLIQCITVTDDWTSVLISMAGELCEILEADGLSIRFDDKTYSHGLAESGEILERMIAIASSDETRNRDYPHVRDPRDESFNWVPDVIGGFLVIPLSHFRDDALVFFRKEMSRKVMWAGDPDKVVDRSDDAPRLKPRASFAAWQETVRGTCELWSAGNLAVASSIRETLSGIVITAHYFRQTLESPAAARHRLAHETNQNPVALADEHGMIVYQNPAALRDPLLGNLQSLDQLGGRLDVGKTFVANALYSLVHDQVELWLPAPNGRLEASRLIEDNRLVGYSLRLIRGG